ncbi:hypothetical protein A2U01_0090104, partial [Trifolium medium]|nr:hypothetical protein [Trifolium medium]
MEVPATEVWVASSAARHRH